MKHLPQIYCLVALFAMTSAADAQPLSLSLEDVFRKIEASVDMKALQAGINSSEQALIDSQVNRLGPLSLSTEIEEVNGERELRSVLEETFRPGLTLENGQKLAEVRSKAKQLEAETTARSLKNQYAQVYLALFQARARYLLMREIISQSSKIFNKTATSMSQGSIDPLAALRWEIIRQRMAMEQTASLRHFEANQNIMSQLVPALAGQKIENVEVKGVDVDLPSAEQIHSFDVLRSELRSDALALEAEQENSFTEFSAGAGVIQDAEQNLGYVFQVSLPIGQKYLQRQRAAALRSQKSAEDSLRNIVSRHYEVESSRARQDIIFQTQNLQLERQLSAKVEALLQKTHQGFLRGLASGLEYLEALESYHHASLDVINAERMLGAATISYLLNYTKVNEI